MFTDKKYNNLLLFFIVLGLICIFSKDTILNNLKKFYEKLFETYEKFTCSSKSVLIDTGVKINVPGQDYDKQRDFPYHSENLQSAEADDLYKFLQSLISKNVNQYDLTTTFSKKHKSDKKSDKTLLKFLDMKLNNSSSSKRISNIELHDKIFFYKNQMSLEIKPFQIIGDYHSNNKFLGKVKLQIEIGYRFDQPNSVFMSQNVFNNFMGVFKFNRITLINHKMDDKVKEEKKNLPIHLEKPKSYYEFNYNKGNIKENGLDTINSLIPEEIQITETEYERSSKNIVSSQKIRV